MENLIGLITTGTPIWILCAGAILCLLIDALWPKKMTTVVYTVGILTLGTSLATTAAQWQSPKLLGTQDLLVMDLMSLFILGIILVIGILTLFNALGYVKLNQTLTSEFCSLLLFSIVGMVFLFCSQNLILNFIGLETMSLAIYVLVGSHKKNLKSNEAALKYFVMGSVASAILLYGIALYYGAFKTMDLNALAQVVPTPSLAYLPRIALSLILLGILFKLAVVPFHFWAPDVYEGAPSPVTGFMATAVKVAAFGFGLRVFLKLGVLELPHIETLLAVVVIATFIVANVVAILQEDVKRMLAYSSISHAGFILFGVLAGFQDGRYNPATADTVLFYLLGYFLMTLGAFAILSLFTKDRSEATGYSDLRGLGKKHPLLAGLFTLFMISMIGIPGTAGFVAKYGVIALAVQNNHLALAVLAVAMTVVSAYYYLRPSVVMFFTDNFDQWVGMPGSQNKLAANLRGDAPAKPVISQFPFTVSIAVTLCAFLTVYIGVNPDVFVTLSQIAASTFVF